MTTKKALSGVGVLRAFFGLKPDQTLKEFAAEIRELSPKDKQELIELAAVELDVEVKKDITPLPKA